VVAHSFFDAIHKHYPQAIKHVTKQALVPVLTHQDETIFETGDACDRMIFAYRGRYIYSQNDKDIHQQCVQKASDRGHDQEIGVGDVTHDTEYGAQEVGSGVWLSEASIWLEWQNQGILTALNEGLFYALEVEQFGLVVKSYIDVLSLVVAYALQFEATLKDQRALSDIIDMEFECFFMPNAKQSMFGGGITRRMKSRYDSGRS